MTLIQSLMGFVACKPEKKKLILSLTFFFGILFYKRKKKKNSKTNFELYINLLVI